MRGEERERGGCDVCIPFWTLKTFHEFARITFFDVILKRARLLYQMDLGTRFITIRSPTLWCVLDMARVFFFLFYFSSHNITAEREKQKRKKKWPLEDPWLRERDLS